MVLLQGCSFGFEIFTADSFSARVLAASCEEVTANSSRAAPDQWLLTFVGFRRGAREDLRRPVEGCGWGGHLEDRRRRQHAPPADRT